MLLIGSAGIVGGEHGPSISLRAVLAELEFTLNSGDWNAETDDAGEQVFAVTVGETAPLLCVGWFIRLDQAGEKSLFRVVVLDELERAICVNGHVVPRGNRESFCVEGWTDVAVRTGEDDESLATREGLPLGICLGEMTFKDAVQAFVLTTRGR